MRAGFEVQGRGGSITPKVLPLGLLTLAAALTGLYFLSLANYLLFHAIVESFSIVVACGVFMIAWNSRRFQVNGFFLCLGVASLFVAGVDFLHTLAYKGMGVFPDAGANLPTQLWIVARYLEASALLLAPFFLSRRAKAVPVLGGYSIATAALLGAVFAGLFPDCFREGTGLTIFKVASEYLICLMMAASLALAHRRARAFDPGILRLLSLAVGAFILAELSFTLYTDVFGLSNMAGHLFKVAGFYCIYRGVIETGLARPYALLFRDLKESEERYRSLYEKTPVMLHSIDRAGNLLSVSEYWLEYLGYEREEVIGEKTSFLLDEESRRRAEDTVLPAFFRTGSCRNVPYRVFKKDGEAIDVLLSAIAERDNDGEIVRSLAVMVDVTERKRYQDRIEALNAELLNRADALEEANTELEAANEELEKTNLELELINDRLSTANGELEAFNYSVSHDLRGPLTAISGQCQIILDIFAHKVDPEVREFIEGIYSQTWQMNNLITTLLEFSRLGKVLPKRERVDLTAMAQLIAEGLTMGDPDRRVSFDIAEKVEAEADPELVQVMLENLLGNAWKYTGKRAEARIEFGRIETAEDGPLFIRDNGAGFDPAHVEDLFTPFKRLHSPRDFEGFGIGLSTVQRIVESHGGRIWAEGAPGEGATFFFTLP